MPASDPYIGKEILGQFKILERIGSGGMGSVYKAEQPAMDRLVAVKILHPKLASRKDLVSRFRREARAMSHLTHPNTVRVFLYGQLDDGSLYIVMEFLEGQNLGRLLRLDGPMRPERAASILIQSCGALDEAHRAGIVHRDLKPENVFLTQQGGLRDFAKVLDFGLAKVTEREMRPGSMILTQEGMVFGTPEFMSPEQAQGKTLDPRSDIYSLGVILYELVTGKLPFEAKTPMEYIGLHVQAVPIPLAQRLPGVEWPPMLQSIMDRALAKDPADRYQSAAEFAAALKTILPREGYTGALRMVPSMPSAARGGAAAGAGAGVASAAYGAGAVGGASAASAIAGSTAGSAAGVGGSNGEDALPHNPSSAPQSIAALNASVRDAANPPLRPWVWVALAAVVAIVVAVLIVVATRSRGTTGTTERVDLALRLDKVPSVRPLQVSAADSDCGERAQRRILDQANRCGGGLVGRSTVQMSFTHAPNGQIRVYDYGNLQNSEFSNCMNAGLDIRDSIEGECRGTATYHAGGP